MSQDVVTKTGLGAILTLIAAPPEFILITLWLLFANTILAIWANVRELSVKNATTVFDVAVTVFTNLLKQLGVLFFLLTGATAISKFGPALVYVESAVYVGVAFWIFSILSKNASRILTTDNFGDALKYIYKKVTNSETSDKP
jgi:hypothetical protein